MMINKMKNESGMAMAVVIPLLLLISFLGIVAVMNSNTYIDIAGSVKRNSQSFYVAEAGLERAVNEYIWGNFYDENSSPMTNPFTWLENLTDSAFYQDVPMGNDGSYTVKVTEVNNPGARSPYIDCRDVTLEATGKANGGSEIVTLTATMRFGILPSGVFDYAYFINHFGWWAGFSSGGAIANGNVRANGHFDLLSGNFTGNGNPRLNPITGEVVDGGGVYAGGYVFPTNGTGYQGMAADSVNRHSYAGTDKSQDDKALLDMPNLNDPADLDGDGIVDELNPYYIGLANGSYGADAGKVGVDKNGNGLLDATEVLVTGTYGDDAGETGNLALVGTDANPIIITGTVAVTKNLAIKGTIKGQGSFYVGRNTYVGSQVKYLNAPTAKPVYNYGHETAEQYDQRVVAWRDANKNKDLVAFMTANNIVAGDHTQSNWKNYIINGSGWLDDYRNNGKEDVGVDGVFGNLQDKSNPYSASTKESDGKFTVIISDDAGFQRLEDLPIVGGVAQVPSGYHIVPGTGEDIDGDGKYGGTYNYTRDINFDATFNSTNFYNLPSTITNYSSFTGVSVTKMDGVFYTNHAIAGWFNDGCTFTGAVIARNESLILTGGHVTLNHDDRLTANYKDLNKQHIYLPLVKSYSTVSWEDKTVH
jgi:hypothetical protein